MIPMTYVQTLIGISFFFPAIREEGAHESRWIEGN